MDGNKNMEKSSIKLHIITDRESCNFYENILYYHISVMKQITRFMFHLTDNTQCMKKK